LTTATGAAGLTGATAFCAAFGRDFTRGRSAVRGNRRFIAQSQRWPRGRVFQTARRRLTTWATLQETNPGEKARNQPRQDSDADSTTPIHNTTGSSLALLKAKLDPVVFVPICSFRLCCSGRCNRQRAALSYRE